MMSMADLSDYWRLDVGVNVIPANSKTKKPLVEWKKWQTEPIPLELHEQWKKDYMFKDGMAVICGQVFHNETRKGLWFNGIDCDNKLGLDEMCPEGIDKIAEMTVVEQHANKEKCHIYFFTEAPIQSQAPLEGENTPKIEIKSGGKSLIFCAGGIHKDGSQIEILNTRQVKIVDKEGLENRINGIFTKHGLTYLKNKSTLNSKPLYQKDNKIKLHKGDNRGQYILSYLDSKKIKNPELDEEDLIHLARKYEKEYCADTYDDDKILELVKLAMKYGENKLGEKKDIDEIQNLLNIIDSEKSVEAKRVAKEKINELEEQTGKQKTVFLPDEMQKEVDENYKILRKGGITKRQQRVAKERIIELQKLAGVEISTFDEENDSFESVATKIMTEFHFKTLSETGAILIYRDGVYVNDNAEVEIKKKCQEMVSDCTVNFANEVINVIKRRTYISFDEFDKNEDIINVSNGLLNVNTCELIEHTPEYPSLVQWGVKYNPTVKCKFIPKFINDVLVDPKERVTAYEMYASLLWKYDKINKSYFPLGIGSNGKSIFCDIAKMFCGMKNISSVSFHELTGDVFAISDLVGKTVNINPDGDDDEIKNIGDWKKIVNHERIRGQAKHEKAFDFTPHCKMIMGFNHPPKFTNRQPATYRRIVPFHFDVVFKKNPTPKDLEKGVKIVDEDFVGNLFTEDELSGLLNIALKTLPRLKKRRYHICAPSDEEVKRIWETKADTIKEFAEESLVIDSNAWISKNDLYSHYRRFCDVKGYSYEGQTRFYGGIVEQLGGKTIKTDRKREHSDENPVNVFSGIWVKGLQKPDHLIAKRTDTQMRVDS